MLLLAGMALFAAAGAVTVSLGHASASGEEWACERQPVLVPVKR